MTRRMCWIVAGLVLTCCGMSASDIPEFLSGTTQVVVPADWREQQRLQMIRFLERRTESAVKLRDEAWSRGSAETHRKNLHSLLGLLSSARAGARVATLAEGAMRIDDVAVHRQDGLRVRALVFSNTGGSDANRPAVIVIPDSDQTAEAFAGIAPGGTPAKWLLRLLAANAVVAVPTMVERSADHPLSHKLKNKDRRHILHRLGFVVGRSLTGLDVQKILLLREELASRKGIDRSRIVVMGTGQGGMTALYAAAAEPSFAGAAVLDYFHQREQAWSEPVDRMLFGQLLEFGDAELAALVAPRKLLLGYRSGSPLLGTAARELARAQEYYRKRSRGNALSVMKNVADPLLQAAIYLVATDSAGTPGELSFRVPLERVRAARDEDFESLHAYLLRLVEESEDRREEYWHNPQPAHMREQLARHEGVPQEPSAPLRPRTRLVRVTDKWTGYEVLLDVFGGLEVYGHLLVPRGANKGLPAVICQHGLDGQPKDITGIGEKPRSPYHLFGAALADRGYVVFAPYLTVPAPQGKLINDLVRRSAPLGMMRTGIEVRKLRAVVDFLSAQPFVDAKRIGYYGLSYGGYSTLWMGPLEPRLAAIVISGHFNDWRSKITNHELATSYLMHPDEDFYSWNALHRFTHPELIAAMSPRPVMVEFAEKDGTTTPEWHQRAWKQVEAMSSALGVADRVEREWFLGVHEIGGMRTFEFLDKWLRPELSSSRDYKYLLWPTTRDLPGLGDNAADTWPFITHNLDSSGKTALRDTFRVSGSGDFRGLELRLSRAGHPGDIIVRFGSAPGASDLGEARIASSDVTPLYDLWHAARIPHSKLAAGREYHVEIRAERGRIPGDYYVVYAPKPLGGSPRPARFPFAYRPLETGGKGKQEEPTHEFVRQYLKPKLPVMEVGAGVSPDSNETVLTSRWTVQRPAQPDEIVETAAAELERFLRTIPSQMESAGVIELRISNSGPEGVHSREGYRIDTASSRITIEARHSRGIMRAIYWLQDSMLSRQGPFLKLGVTVRNERFPRRITTSITPGGERYTETSRPLLYTDGLLQRISRDGFNAIWIWLNTEEAAWNSRIFPELDDPQAHARLARLQDVARRAKRFGIDVYIYLATGYNHHIPEWFYKKYPDLKGYGWGSPMETTILRVREYHAEIVGNIFRYAPDLKGMVVIYDSEGFYHSGNREASRKQCRTCQDMTLEEISLQLLNNLNDAMRATGGNEKELIAWSYGDNVPWVERLIPRLPKNVIVQSDFSKGGLVVRDGIRHLTGDYNLTLVGPPESYVRQHRAAKQAGLDFVTKTEHAVSQEFIFVPYIPAMEQWARRIGKIRSVDTEGIFANWCHYGYMASLPAQLLNEMSFDPAPDIEAELHSLAVRNYGPQSAPLVVRAWRHLSDGIREFPYSDNVSRIPGPLQKGPSHPFFLDPKIPNFGRWRSWQNDLAWTKPWGPAVAAKYLGKVRAEFVKGAALLDEARTASQGKHREALDAEWRIATLLESSLATVLHLIDWIEARSRFYGAQSDSERAAAARELESVLIAERANVQRVLPLLEADSRLGYASEGGGVLRGGLFTPELVRWKLGQIDNVLRVELPRLSGRSAAAVPSTIREAVAGASRN
ncbi:MAG: prolyl oligopeptidase family serine peptidase [Bryobacterales bacterium]|nr:prolyl oligopeptidase family serine peptidase [Bryobacterales bacterium]